MMTSSFNKPFDLHGLNIYFSVVRANHHYIARQNTLVEPSSTNGFSYELNNISGRKIAVKKIIYTFYYTGL